MGHSNGHWRGGLSPAQRSFPDGVPPQRLNVDTSDRGAAWLVRVGKDTAGRAVHDREHIQLGPPPRLLLALRVSSAKRA